MPIFEKSYPHPNKWREETMGPDKSANHVTLQESNSLKDKCILDHVPVWLLSCNWKMTPLTSAKLNSLHLNIQFTATLAVNLTIR